MLAVRGDLLGLLLIWIRELLLILGEGLGRGRAVGIHHGGGGEEGLGGGSRVAAGGGRARGRESSGGSLGGEVGGLVLSVLPPGSTCGSGGEGRGEIVRLGREGRGT